MHLFRMFEILAFLNLNTSSAIVIIKVSFDDNTSGFVENSQRPFVLYTKVQFPNVNDVKKMSVFTATHFSC